MYATPDAVGGEHPLGGPQTATASRPTDSSRDPFTALSGYSGAPEAPPAHPTPRGRSWSAWLRSTRARVVAVYLLLLVVSGVLIVFTIRQVLTIRLDGRVDEALRKFGKGVLWDASSGGGLERWEAVAGRPAPPPLDPGRGQWGWRLVQ